MKKSKLALLLLAAITFLPGCSKFFDGKIHVSFDTCIDLKTNTIKEQVYDEPHKVKKPIVVIIDENPDSLELYGWYTSKDYKTQWNFSKDIAEKSMTLYAKFESQYQVNYYQGIDENNIALIATELVFKGNNIPTREDLPDCYENPGTYYISDIITDENGVTKATKGAEVNFASDKVLGAMNILMERSTNFYFTPDAIKRRFTPTASCAGTYGSTEGSIEVCTEETTGDKYAKVDFGNVSEKDPAVDPYILIDNPQIDVTSSQWIEITVKNIGVGDTLSFYWVGKWKQNGQWINGKEYHSFAEDRRFAFKKGTGTNDESTVYTDLNGNHFENNSTQWKTYLLPISNKTSNGVSVWGCAGKITALRIQMSFQKSLIRNGVSPQNVLYIKSIKGVKDTTKTYDFIDSKSLNSYKINSSKNDLEQASKAQNEINGFIFPKNNDQITEVETGAVYKRTDGIYVSGSYLEGKQTITLTANKEIDLNTHTTFKFKYRNFSYVDKLSFVFKVKYTEGLSTRETKVTQTFSCSTRMTSSEEAKINMFGTSNFKGVLTGISVYYTPAGIDNLFQFEYFKFDDYEPRNVFGYNFYDLNCGGFQGTTGIDLIYDQSSKSTKATITDSTKSISKSVSNFDTTSLEKMTINYTRNDVGVTGINVILITDSESETHSLDISGSTGTGSKDFVLKNHGALEKVLISFNGTGAIFLKSALWVYFDDTLDFTTGEYLTYKNCAVNDTGNSYTFDKNELALCTSGNSNAIYGRLGSRYKADNLTINGKKMTNMSLAGKSKIVITYQNRSTTSGINMGFGAFLKADYLENGEYLYKEALPSNQVTIGSTTKNGGTTTIRELKTSMKSGEWATAELPIDSFFTSQENECYLSVFFFATNSALNGSYFLIRNFTLL